MATPKKLYPVEGGIDLSSCRVYRGFKILQKLGNLCAVLLFAQLIFSMSNLVFLTVVAFLTFLSQGRPVETDKLVARNPKYHDWLL